MRVFISWSGAKAKGVALCLRQSLPRIIQAVNPWMSDEDISPGQRPFQEIAAKLEECSVGICVITAENVERPWLNFEMGALSKSLKAGKPMPLLFGLKPANLTGPITLFQCFEATKEGMLRIVKEINNSMERPIEDKILEHAFNAVWTEIDNQFKKIENENKNITPQAIRGDREILEEILETLRNIDKKSFSSVGTLQHGFERSADKNFAEAVTPSISPGVSSPFVPSSSTVSKIEKEQNILEPTTTKKGGSKTRSPEKKSVKTKGT